MSHPDLVLDVTAHVLPDHTGIRDLVQDAHLVPVVNPALRSANLGLCAVSVLAVTGHVLPEHAVNPSVGARLRPSLAADGSGSTCPVTAFDLQLRVKNAFLEVQLKLEGRAGG